MRPILSTLAPLIGGGGGGGGGLDTQIVTTGGSGQAGNENRRRGFLSGTFGAISDGTSNLYSGASILSFYWDENGGGAVDLMKLSINGTLSNSGWTTVTIDGLSFNRAAATFSASGGQSSWTWPSLGYTYLTQPFGINGSTPTATFT